MRQGYFEIEGVGTFAGWTDGSHWNGWATPLFEKDVADQIVQGYNSSGTDGGAWYNPEQDAYCLSDTDDEEPLAFSGRTVETPGGTKRLYPLATRYWTWEEAT